MAAALKQGSGCAECISAMSGTITDCGGQQTSCTGVAAACDLDQGCQDLIAQTNEESATNSSSSPGCWLYDASVALDNAGLSNAVLNDFGTCIVFLCASACGDLSTSGCE